MLINHCNKGIIVVVFLLLTRAPNSFSQDYSYIRYDTRDGLAGSLVYDVIQDKDGFMWFATENGLSRFDGKNFKTFTTKDGLPDDEILKLFLDSRGRLWIMPFKPSICYYFKGKIYNQQNDQLLSKVSLSNYGYNMAEDKSGNLFIAESNALHTILPNGAVKSRSYSFNTDVQAIGLDKNGAVELLLANNHFPNVDSIHLVFALDGLRKSLNIRSDLPTMSTSLIDSGYIVISRRLNSYLTIYRETENLFTTRVPKNTVSVNDITREKIAINTLTGVQILDLTSGTLSDLFFKDFSITSTFQDKENNFWLTTAGTGVLMVPSFQFKSFPSSENGTASEILALRIKEDTLYAGGTGAKVWKISVNNQRSTAQTIKGNGNIISILPLDNGLFWVHSRLDQNPFLSAKTIGNLKGMTIKSASIGKSGLLLAGHSNVVLCKWDGTKEVVWRNRATSAVEKDSGYYIGTLNGLYYVSYGGDTSAIAKNFPFLGSRIVNLVVSGNDLWVLTKGEGVVVFREKKLLHHYVEAEGLTSDNSSSLFVDGDVVWVGTDKGLNRIESSGRGSKITHFTTSDGLPSNMINAIAVSGKTVFVGTPAGLTYFEVDKISQKSTCDLQMTAIYVANKHFAYDSTQFSLAHRDDDIRFEYSGISFKSGGEIQYQYRLLGLQPDWRMTIDDQLSFTSLPSGNYVLQLKAINKYGVESQVKEITFLVEKLIWEKTWFKIAGLLLVITSTWGFFRYRIRRVRRKEKEQAKINQRITELEQKSLRSQMNPHFIFNSLNSIQQYVMERDIAGANNFITDFSRLIRMTLDLSTYSSISLSDEINYIDTYLRLEKTRLEDHFEYSINIDKAVDPNDVFLPPLMLQPYVENCIRHGMKYKKEGRGLIKICAQKKETGILISIEDNGIGREAAQKYKSKYHIQYQSKGMAINKDRIDTLNISNERKIEIHITDLHDEHNEAAGTRVDVLLIQ